MCSWAVVNPISMVNVTFVNNKSEYGDGAVSHLFFFLPMIQK